MQPKNSEGHSESNQVNRQKSAVFDIQKNITRSQSIKVNHLLKATAELTNALLSDDNLDRGVNKALEILGASGESDRLTVMKHHSDATGKTNGCLSVKYEWLSSGTVSQINHSQLRCISYDGIEECFHLFCEGKHWGGLLKIMPEAFRSGQQKLEVKATYAIPIMVDGKYWGILGFDFCEIARELCDAEIAVLKTAATCIGSAIEREHSRCAKEESQRAILLKQHQAIELNKRNYLLNLTANVAQALLDNQNLATAIANALEIIGEGIDTDRVAVMEHHEDSTGESLGYVKMLFEWHSPHAVSQLNHPKLCQISYEGIEDWYEHFNQGEAAGGIVEEFPEPLRSKQIEIGVKSLYSVPIIINGKYWGLIGFDDCREAKQRSESEISILKTTAACVGSAIQQSRIRQETEQTKRNLVLEHQRVTQLQKHNRVLQRRDRILAATAEAANILLTEEDFDKAVNKALQIIGETIDTDRVAVIENFHHPSSSSNSLNIYWKVIYEWNSAYAISQINHPEVCQGSYKGIEEWFSLFSKGESISARQKEIPEPFRSGQLKIGVKVLHCVPIIIKGEFWGVIGFDDCRKEIHRSEAELSILKTTAACIGGAIQQQRIRCTKEEAERNFLLEKQQAATEKAAQLEQHNQILSSRDRWLEATANAANKLLEIADFDRGINAALKILGESIDCDRVTLMQHFEDSKGLVRLLYEWDSPGTISQISHPKLNQISAEGIEDWFVKLKAGEWIGGTIDELKEPFRSGQIELGVQSTYSVPIFVNNFVNNFYWGAIGIDFCQQSKRLTLAEISVFKTAASCIGSAIYRQQIQQEKERAELAILDERNRMAREIHDSLAQAFTGISLQLEAAKNALITNPETVRERLNRAKNLAKEGITEARRSVRALRPEVLEAGDLTTAIGQLMDKMISGTNIKYHFRIEGQPRFLTPEIQVELFRIAQEAITNTVRHAQASEINVELIYETNTIHLFAKDNGKGFNPQTSYGEGFGLIGMRQRCDRLKGDLTINSAIGKGTEIIVTAEVVGSW